MGSVPACPALGAARRTEAGQRLAGNGDSAIAAFRQFTGRDQREQLAARSQTRLPALPGRRADSAPRLGRGSASLLRRVATRLFRLRRVRTELSPMMRTELSRLTETIPDAEGRRLGSARHTTRG